MRTNITHRRSRRRGASPLELLVAVVVAALLVSTAIPAARRALDQAAVVGSARRIASAHLMARTTAILTSRTTLFTVRGDSMFIHTVAGADTTLTWRDRGPLAQEVAVAGPTRPMRFSPVGIMEGVTNGTWRLTRGSAARNVIVARLGRLRIVRP